MRPSHRRILFHYCFDFILITYSFLQDVDFDFSCLASPSCGLFVGNMKTILLTRSLSIEHANIEIQAPERSGAVRMREGGLLQFHVSALYRTN